MTVISHTFGAGKSGSVLDLPINSRLLARGFIATYDERYYTPMPKKNFRTMGMQHASKAPAPNQNAVMVEQMKKIMQKHTQQQAQAKTPSQQWGQEKQPQPTFHEYSQARPIR